MSIITFWSETNKRIGQTLSAAATATYMAMEHNYKVLLVSLGAGDTELKSVYGDYGRGLIKMKDKVSLASGIEELVKMSLSNRLTPDIICNYTKVVYKNRLEILYGPKTTDLQTYAKMLDTFKDIIKNADKHYDMVIVDAPKGKKYAQTKEILDMSNVIIVDFEQRMSTLEPLAQLRKTDPFYTNPRILLLINKYDRYSKYNQKNVTRYLGEKQEVFTIPYNTMFFESAQEATLAEMFLKIRRLDVTDKNGYFLNEAKKVCEGIIYKLQELQMI